METRIAAGNHRCPCRAANLVWGVMPGKPQAARREGIDVRCLRNRVTCATETIRLLLVGAENQEIGGLSGHFEPTTCAGMIDFSLHYFLAETICADVGKATVPRDVLKRVSSSSAVFSRSFS